MQSVGFRLQYGSLGLSDPSDLSRNRAQNGMDPKLLSHESLPQSCGG